MAKTDVQLTLFPSEDIQGILSNHDLDFDYATDLLD
jgi:hypothetical protein